MTPCGIERVYDDGSEGGTEVFEIITKVVDAMVITVLSVDGTDEAGMRTGDGGSDVAGGKTTVERAVVATGEWVTTGVVTGETGAGETGAGDGLGETGAGDGETGVGAGETGAGDGDGEATGDGDGLGETGAGDGETGTGDGVGGGGVTQAPFWMISFPLQVKHSASVEPSHVAHDGSQSKQTPVFENWLVAQVVTQVPVAVSKNKLA
jgi:hypothetical protein